MTELAQAIENQPHDIEEMLALDLTAAVAKLQRAKRIWLVGTGTSQHAAELGAWMFSCEARDVHAISAATFAWHPAKLDSKHAVIVISHTGETAFASRARRRALDAGAELVAITARGSRWPEAVPTVSRERSETYTRSYTAALIVLARLAIELGHAPFDASELRALPGAVRAAAQARDELPSTSPRLIAVTGGRSGRNHRPRGSTQAP